jgi:hypothetical protein
MRKVCAISHWSSIGFSNAQEALSLAGIQIIRSAKDSKTYLFASCLKENDGENDKDERGLK